MRRHPHLLVLALLGSLALCATALAAAPPAKEGTEASPAPPATPTMNPITAVKAMNQSIRAGEQQTRAAMDSMGRAESRSAPSAPAPRPGGGKVIYGDIIIYK
ncbi:MAG: hypothetical protein CVU73_10400 [Deltaproteobacteria bacterium HGW-Deltaproteobacteria-8]|jgi:uncharacterized protein involved in copper resistance|nr:MAG: hypothetical protein CVU73_10400 [Deltaproteobacteria bacterium HGW-Deltaproteobacteria-8]